uniref:TSA: Wollemia nobilis Ref_Wollemi_Transcript_10739_872 transcribed RNA sequence n=1 Tax=Wollemia nobilis TaxID=56998 RepID=A0A0C9RMJ3_9CONI
MGAADDAAMKALQSKIRYQFKDQMFLIRAMTHASYSFDNNAALSVLGSSVIQSAISLRYILSSSSIGKGDLYSKVAENSNCTVLSQDAFDLQLHELIRVAPKVNPKEKNILCSCYHALFGAIGVDAKNLDIAKEKLWRRHGWNSTNIIQKQLMQEGLHLAGLDDME